MIQYTILLCTTKADRYPA